MGFVALVAVVILGLLGEQYINYKNKKARYEYLVNKERAKYGNR